MTRYAVVPDRSRVVVEVQSTLRQLELASSDLSGEVEAELRDGRLESAGARASFSLPSQSLVSGTWLIDRDVREMFEVRKFPEISGDLLEVKNTDDGDDYLVRGTLRLHGVSCEVEGRARIVEMSDHHAVFEGEMMLDYTRFNLKAPKLLMLRVEPEVMIRGHVHAERQS
jgi:polyisoprenoid-binding protein YceI